MTHWRIDGALQVRRPEDDLLLGRILHDGRGWVAEARLPGQAEIRQAGFARAEDAADWLLARDPRPTPAAADPEARTLPGGCVVLTIAARGGWILEAVLRGRPLDVPNGIASPYAAIRLVVRDAAQGGAVVAAAAEETGAHGRRQIVARVPNPDHPWKSRARPYATLAKDDPLQEARIVEALVRATRPKATTAHETLEDLRKEGASDRAERLRRAQTLRERLATGRQTG